MIERNCIKSHLYIFKVLFILAHFTQDSGTPPPGHQVTNHFTRLRGTYSGSNIRQLDCELNEWEDGRLMGGNAISFFFQNHGWWDSFLIWLSMLYSMSVCHISFCIYISYATVETRCVFFNGSPSRHVPMSSLRTVYLGPNTEAIHLDLAHCC